MTYEQTALAGMGSCDLLADTRRERILAEVNRRADWRTAVERCAPHWPTPGAGRQPWPVELLLRFELVRHLWQIDSTDALLEFVADSRAVELFIGPELRRRRPGRATLDRFRHSMESAGVLAWSIGALVSSVARYGYRIERGALQDPHLVVVLDGVTPGSREAE
jgi:IS5 family transposase